MTIRKIDIRHFVFCPAIGRRRDPKSPIAVKKAGPTRLLRLGCDPPSRATSIFYATTLVFIFFLHRLLNGNRAGVQRASISRVNVRHVDVDVRLDWRPAGQRRRRP